MDGRPMPLRDRHTPGDCVISRRRRRDRVPDSAAPIPAEEHERVQMTTPHVGGRSRVSAWELSYVGSNMVV
jgi:hypothetical protein